MSRVFFFRWAVALTLSSAGVLHAAGVQVTDDRGVTVLRRAVDHEVPRLDRVGEPARHGVDPRRPPLAATGVREEPGGQVERQQAHVTSLPAVSTGLGAREPVEQGRDRNGRARGLQKKILQGA